MEIKEISIEELKKIEDEGLVLQGCGGDVEDWVNGINEMLTNEQILLNQSKFMDVKVFKHEELTNLLFHMKDVELDIGKLAMWRLGTHQNFGGTWLSDYLPNKLNVEMGQSVPKPECELIGQNGNIYNLMGIAERTLKENGLNQQAEEMRTRITSSNSYDEALMIIADYVEITGPNEIEIEQEFTDY